MSTKEEAIQRLAVAFADASTRNTALGIFVDPFTVFARIAIEQGVVPAVMAERGLVKLFGLDQGANIPWPAVCPECQHEWRETPPMGWQCKHCLMCIDHPDRPPIAPESGEKP